MAETFRAQHVHEVRETSLEVLDQQAKDWFGETVFPSLEVGPVSAVMDANGVTSRRTYTLPDPA